MDGAGEWARLWPHEADPQSWLHKPCTSRGGRRVACSIAIAVLGDVGARGEATGLWRGEIAAVSETRDGRLDSV